MSKKNLKLPLSIDIHNLYINDDEIEILIGEDRYSTSKMLLRLFWGLIIITGAALYALYFTQPINGEIALGAGSENPIIINTNASFQHIVATVHDNLIIIGIMLSVFIFITYLLLLWAHWNINTAYNYFFNKHQHTEKYISINKSLFINFYKITQREPPLDRIQENIRYAKLDVQPAAVGSITTISLDSDNDVNTSHSVVFYYPGYVQDDNHYFQLFQTKDTAERLVAALSRFFSIPVLAPRTIDKRPPNHSSR